MLPPLDIIQKKNEKIRVTGIYIVLPHFLSLIPHSSLLNSVLLFLLPIYRWENWKSGMSYQYFQDYMLSTCGTCPLKSSDFKFRILWLYHEPSPAGAHYSKSCPFVEASAPTHGCGSHQSPNDHLHLLATQSLSCPLHTCYLEICPTTFSNTNTCFHNNFF